MVTDKGSSLRSRRVGESEEGKGGGLERERESKGIPFPFRPFLPSSSPSPFCSCHSGCKELDVVGLSLLVY